MLDAKLLADEGDGAREEIMPHMREAWRRALAALDREAEARAGARFATLAPQARDAILADMQAGRLTSEHWQGLDPKVFFTQRVLVDVPALFYALRARGARSASAAPPLRAA